MFWVHAAFWLCVAFLVGLGVFVSEEAWQAKAAGISTTLLSVVVVVWFVAHLLRPVAQHDSHERRDLTAQAARWRDELKRTGEVRIASSRRFATFGAVFFSVAALVGAIMWTEGDHLKGALIVVFSAGFTTLATRTLLTGNPRIVVTTYDVRAFGVVIAWKDVTWVAVEHAGGRGRRMVVLGCTDDAQATIWDQLPPPARFTHRLAGGLRNRFGLPATLNADVEDLAAWFDELSSDSGLASGGSTNPPH
jgi:hypothetical protein